MLNQPGHALQEGDPTAAGSSSPPSGLWTAETTATPCELSLAIVFARPVGGVSASVILNRPSPPNSEPRTDSDPVYLESTMRIATCPSEYQLVCPPRYTGPDPNPNVPVESAGQLADWPVLEGEHPATSKGATMPAIARRVIRRTP